MKFIHAADLHIGAAFSGIRQPNGVVASKLLNAPNEALNQLIQDACTQDVDFVILAGDLFATPQPDQQSLLQFRTAMAVLAEANIPVFAGTGNHDFGLRDKLQGILPENVHLFADQGETFSFVTREQQSIAISGFSYNQRHLSTSLMPTFPQRDMTVDYHIGVYHGEQSGTSGQYAPFTVPDMLAKQYDYWALGHIHQRNLLHERPFIAYAGNLQGYHEKEVGAKGYQLVMDVNGSLTPQFVSVAPVEWVKAEIEANDPQIVVESLRKAFMDVEAFQLITLNVLTDNQAVQQQILQHIFDVNYFRQAEDPFWVVDVHLENKQVEALPTVDQAYWDQSYDEVFNEQNLYDLGLKTVKDPILLAELTSPAFMNSISDKAQGLIQSVTEVTNENN